MDEDTVKSRGLRRNLSRRGLFSIVDFGGLQKSNKIFKEGTTPPVCFPILPHSLILVAFLGGDIV